MHGHTSLGQSAKTYIHHLCVDPSCHLEDFPRVITDRDGWQERESRAAVLSACHDDDDDDLAIA